jgi:hypothetical protein
MQLAEYAFVHNGIAHDCGDRRNIPMDESLP